MAAGYLALWMIQQTRTDAVQDRAIKQMQSLGTQTCTLRWREGDEVQSITCTRLPGETVDEWLARASAMKKEAQLEQWKFKPAKKD